MVPLSVDAWGTLRSFGQPDPPTRGNPLLRQLILLRRQAAVAPNSATPRRNRGASKAASRRRDGEASVTQELQRTAFSSDELLEALSQCDFVADQSLQHLVNGKSLSCRTVDSVVLSERLAVVRRGQRFGTYVIFRGTESRGLGTWLITNCQAASTAFRAIDPDLEHRGGKLPSELPVQRATSKIVAPGVVHQGFLRTWSQLWYGSDIPGTTFHTPASAWRLWVRYIVVAGAVAASAWALGSALPTTAMLALIAVLLAMALESGSLERLFWWRRPLLGEPGEPLLGLPRRSSETRNSPTTSRSGTKANSSMSPTSRIRFPPRRPLRPGSR